jgi:hypothetical protein
MPHVILMAPAPIFFVMALGFVAGRMRAIDSHHVDEINALVMNFAHLPHGPVGALLGRLRGSRSERFLRTRPWPGTQRNGRRRLSRYLGS